MKPLELIVLILIVGLVPQALAGGVGASIHPVPPPSPEEAGPFLRLPQAKRDQVHVMLINGSDPANLFKVPLLMLQSQ